MRHYYLYDDGLKNAVASTGFIVLRKKKNSNYSTKNLYYFLSLNHIVEHLNNIAQTSQTTFPTFSYKDIARISLPKINFCEQNKIVDILSSYDDLENNNKRIKILEQMAENIYKEWFVKFRFPGWEEVEFEEKNPRGWRIGNKTKHFVPKMFCFDELIDIGEFVRGKNITSAQMKEGNIPVIVAGLEPSGFHNKANVKGNSLTISASGANAGFLKYNLNDIWAADCSYCQNDENIWFVYNTLKFLQPVITNMQAGAVQPHVYPKYVNKLSILIPTQELINKYNKLTSNLYNEVHLLEKQNKNLAIQGDLLLSRLISGKLEIK